MEWFRVSHFKLKSLSSEETMSEDMALDEKARNGSVEMIQVHLNLSPPPYYCSLSWVGLYQGV